MDESRLMKPRRTGAAFTLIELLVVIAIIALLLAVLLPALRSARESARSVVCRSHLKTLALANELYAAGCEQWYVAALDTTLTSRGEPTWNSNAEFRRLVGLQDASVGSAYSMPEEYLCPSDRQSNEEYWNAVGVTYQNFVSYGYNLTDWGPSSRRPAVWSGNIPASNWACRLRVGDIRLPAEKIMFTDAGDLWVRMAGADYRAFWDREGQDIVRYRNRGMWQPVYYRHKEGANVAWFDGHVEFVRKEGLFSYLDASSPDADTGRNEALWFCNPLNRKAP